MLLPVLACYGGDLGEHPMLQMLTQHARIRGLAMRLSDELEQDEVREDTLRSLGKQLEAHIRLEEREVFPLIDPAESDQHVVPPSATELDVEYTSEPFSASKAREIGVKTFYENGGLHRKALGRENVGRANFRDR